MPDDGVSSDYTRGEVVWLVRSYLFLSARRPGDGLHTRLLDLQRGLRGLSEASRQAIVLCGFGGMHFRQAAERLGVPKSSIADSYHEGITQLMNTMNGMR